MTTFVSGALVLLLAACAPQDAPNDTTLVESDDPELRELARELLPDLSDRSGLELREPVRIARRTRAELVEYLEAKLDEDMPPERQEHVTRSYALLGLVPEDLDLREILVSVYTEQVSGFYDPDSTALFVLEDQPSENLRTVLIHELVHAVQDQAVNLDSLTAFERGNDRQVAAQAAIEGHATVVMLEYLMEQARGSSVDLSEIPDFTSQVRPALQSLRGQFPALSGAPRVIQESLLFPYLEGAGFVQALWRRGQGRPAPFGEHLPESTEQVLDPTRLLEAPLDDPTPIELAVEGAAPVYENGLGEMETRILSEELAGGLPTAGALGWDGDRFALFEDSDGTWSLAWVAVWDDEEARNAFVEALRPALSSLSRDASLEAPRVEGRPVSLLRVGAPPDVRIRLGAGGGG